MSEIADRIAKLSPQQRSLLEKRLATEAPRQDASTNDAGSEPIAIVGAACRLPGGANDLDSYWQLLREGIDAITEAPKERWDVERLFEEDPDAPGKISSRWGGFIEGVDQFDADYFGISPREAAEMDPQQRLLLETAIDALDYGGISQSELAGSEMGVFVGVHSQSSDYKHLQNANLEEVDMFSGTGTSHSLLAGRLAYFLDVHGPAMAVDTACSSSLVALHLAVQSLRSRECSNALVAGVNLILTPDFTIAASRMHMLSADGRCKAFDASADGYVRSEGCAAIVLRRLTDALADRDEILAIIRGSAVNQDGRTNGVTAPNGNAQRRVIQQALADASAPASTIGFVEAHGTGTALGDPIEFEALAATVGQPAKDATPCFVGSVKTNVGHLESAAGLAGLLKAVLSLRHGEIPPNLHFKKLNPHINDAGTRLKFPVKAERWVSGETPRRAAVSSFGWSGTNAHVVLEEAPNRAPVSAPAPEHKVRLLPISGFDGVAATALARDVANRLRAEPALDIDDVCFTAGSRRTHYDYRRAVTGTSNEELARAIDKSLEEQGPPKRAGKAPRIAFVFPGHGAQWTGMGRILLEGEPLFRDAIARCDAAIRAEAGWSLIDEINAPAKDSRLGEPEIAQPAVFAFGVALAELWASWGVTPDAVTGHSMGEIAAAHVAGALSLEDAVRIICQRSKLLQGTAARGGMLLTDLSEEEAREELANHKGRLSIGAVNSPRSTVFAGDHQALDTLAADLTAREVFCRIVPGSPPGHSHLVAGLDADLHSAIANAVSRDGKTPFYSTVTAKRQNGTSLDAAYWASNLRQPVRFHDTVRALLADGIDTFLELGPHPILSHALGDIVVQADRSDSSVEAAVLPSLRRDEDDHEVLYSTLAQLYERGADLRWKAIVPANGEFTPLPAYPWQRKRFWLSRTPAKGQVAQASDYLALAEAGLPDWLYKTVWTPAPPSQPAAAAGGFLIVAGTGEESIAFATALERAISQAGGTALILADADPAAALENARNDDREWTGIVHCAALDAAPVTAISAETLTNDPAPGRRSFLATIRALDAQAWKGEPRLWVATRGAAVVSEKDSSDLAIAQVAMSGYARTAHTEHPALFGSWIDLDPRAALAEQAADLITGMGGDARETAIAFRSRDMFIERLARFEEAPAASPVIEFRPDAAYLVTGGLGGVGLFVLPWMIARGARHLLVLGRTPLPPRATWRAFCDDPKSQEAERVSAILELEALGAAVHYEAVDVADESQLGEVLARWRADCRPTIGGVVHAAATPEFGLLSTLEAGSAERVFGAKARGAWLLHEAVPEADWMLLFSSMAAFIPSAGAGDYAAANAFIDALGHLRHSRGLKGASIGWGLWSEVARKASEGIRDAGELYADNGILGIPAVDALRALDALVARPAPHALVLNLDKEALSGSTAGVTWPLLRGLTEGDATSVSNNPQDAFADQLTRTQPEEVAALLANRIIGHVETVLKLEGNKLDRERPFGEYGLNSLMALELRVRLERDLGMRLPAALVFNYPTVNELSEHLSSRLAGAHTGASQSADHSTKTDPAINGDAAGDQTARLTELEDLSDDDALAALRGAKTERTS